MIIIIISYIINDSSYTPRVRRRIQDGRLCAEIFVYDKATHTDCITSITPDGQKTGREWCYVDSMYKDGTNWGYCIPTLDYDKLIETNFMYTKEIIKKTNKLNSEIQKEINPGLQSLEEIKYVETEQSSLENKLRNFNNELFKINEVVNELKKQKEILTEKEKKLSEIKFEVNTYEKENNKNKDLANCKGLLLYEEEDRGDGLLGKYYDNENWLGIYKEKISNEINYDWTDSEPLPGINIDNFSIEWEGWLKIPITDDYIFHIECDDGALLYLNNELIISHNTDPLVKNYKKSSGNYYNSKSNSIHLIGGVKVMIKLKYFHSVHTTIYKKGQSFIKLKWSSEEWDEKIIDKAYLYSSYNYPPLKITGYSSEESILQKLTENDSAFINSQNYIIQDIPNDLVGLTQLKLKTLYTKNDIDVYITTPSDAYVAFISYYPNPLDSEWEDTGMTMSLLQIDNLNAKVSKKLIATHSAELKIYKKKFKRGNIKINLKKNGINEKGIPLIVFFGFDISEGHEMICTGKEKIISDSNTKSFKGCRASSELKGYKCEDGFKNKFRDEPGLMWATKSDGVGSWIEIYFDHYYEVTKFLYKNRHNPSERNSLLQLDFSNGQKMMIELKNNDELISVDVDNIKCTSVRITIKGTYDTLNNGGAFAFKGLSCENINKLNNNYVDNDKSAPLFENSIKNVITLNCMDSISNSDKFENINLDVPIMIKCPESCLLSPYKVYGTKIYSKDSAICKSAYHDKKISSNGGTIIINIKKDREINYVGSTSNGIKSLGKEKSSISFTIEKYIEEDNIILKPGTKVDLRQKNEQGKFNWVPAIIAFVKQTKNNKFLKLNLDGINSKTVEYSYDKNIIHPCGEHIKNRECKGSLKFNTQNVSPIMIRFVPKGYNSSPKYLSDYGNIYGMKSNKNYGWSIDMTKNVKARGTFTDNNLLETFIEFPPNQNSNECTKQNPTKLCEPVIWKVKSGFGRFKVTIFAGDVLKDFQMDLRINNKIVIKGKIVKKNTLEKFTDIVDDKNGFLEFSSVCDENCQNSNTKINAVQIVPYFDNKDQQSDDNLVTEKQVCGNSFIKGRCDKGPNILHCIYDDPNNSVTQNCNNDKILVMIPDSSSCKNYVGYYKCVNRIYSNVDECSKYCPKKCSADGRCV